MGIKTLVLFFLISYGLLHCDELIQQDTLTKDFDTFNKLVNSEKSYENTITLLSDISNVNKPIFDEYAKKIDFDETLAVSQCLNASAKELVDLNSDCIAVGLTLKKALTLTPLELNTVILKTEDKYPLFAKELKIINSPIPFTRIISSSKDIIYDLYLGSTNEFLFNKLNYRLPLKTIEKIKDDERFGKFLTLAISNVKLNFLQGTFLEFDDATYNHNISFLLGLNRVLNKKYDEKTIDYFKNALSKATLQEEKDKTLFWLYMLTKDDGYLTPIKESKSLNIYTFQINNLQKKDFKNSEDFKVLKYDFLKDCSNGRKVLINSFAKTLSNFDESLISPEFNLGLMQIDLIKTKSIAKSNNLEVSNEELLIPKTNILYFSYILNELETEFYHPLTLFYAYIYDVNSLNSRLNFDLFKTKNMYEPYLSLELLSSEKSKDFIMNYLIYNKIINKKELTVEEFFKNLFQPSDFH